MARNQSPASPQQRSGQLATPPPSPSLKRKYERENTAETSSRSTKTLRRVCVGADLTEAPHTEVPRTLAHTFANAGTDEEGLDLLVKDHITLMEREIENIDYETAIANIKAVIKIASYIPLEATRNVRCVDKTAETELIWMFLAKSEKFDPSHDSKLTDCSGIVTHIVGEVEAAVHDREKSSVGRLAYRWNGLRHFNFSMKQAEKGVWMFLVLHRMIYGKLACVYPKQAGMSGKSPIQIRAIVDEELEVLTCGGDLDTIKVCPRTLRLLM
jgi:hypothetical protein